MKAWDIVGWTYDAGVHCPDCAAAAGMTADDATDREGNPPHPIFADATDADDGETCEDCGTPLQEGD